MSKENYEMQFIELMASLIAQTPETADAPPVEVKAEPQPEPKAETSVEEMLGIQVLMDEANHGEPEVRTALIEDLTSPGVPKSAGIPVTAITDEGVTEDAVLASGPPDLSEEEREDLVWKAITEDCPGVGKTAEEPAVIDPLRQRLART